MRAWSTCALVALVATALAASSRAHATPFVPRAQMVERAGAPAHSPDVARDVSPADARAQLAKIAAWDKTMQSHDACTTPDAGAPDAGDAGAGEACTFGGIREVESGPGYVIVESDNTQEALWLWSFHRTLTSDATYAPEQANAFEYLATSPGYLEWQDPHDPGPDYYSLYNCGWGIRAVLAYETATGDTSHRTYGATCAQQIHDYAAVPSTARVIDAATSAWAASALWMWGDATGAADLKTKAADIGAQAKSWLEVSASTRLSSRTWAVTGGAVFYGVALSYMKEHPSELAAWAAQMAPALGGWIDESQIIASDWTDWRNAHSAWNMLAQFTAADALGAGAGNAHRQIAQDILTRLVAQDTDGDGAIAGSAQRPVTEDQSWITAYFAYFGLREAITVAAPPPDTDAGVFDAGAPPSPPSTPDGGNGAPPSSGDSGGCACEAAGRARGGSLPLALALGASALVVALARVRRRRTSP